MFGARPQWAREPRGATAVLITTALCLALSGCTSDSHRPQLKPNRITEGFISQKFMNQLTADLAAKKKDQFLANFAEPARSAVALWWDNLAALGTTIGVVADSNPGPLLDENRNVTLKIVAGARNSLDPVNADIQKQKVVPATEYQVVVHVDEATKTPIITSWVSLDHAPWDEGKRLYVRKMGDVVVAGYPEERAAVDGIASAAKKAADYDLALYRAVGSDLLHQTGFVVFTSASLAIRGRWFQSGDDTKGRIVEPAGTSVPLIGASTRTGDATAEDGGIAARVIVQPDLGSGETAILVHEFVHANLTSRGAIWGSGDEQMPAWISEGIARLVEDTYRSSPDPTRQVYSAQVLKDSLASLSKSKLTGALPTDDQMHNGADVSQWYDVAASVYYYIGHTYGIYKAYYAAEAAYGTGNTPFDNVIKSADKNGTPTMYDPSVIKRDWKRWLTETYG
jgi:hypothetical protein